MQPGELIRAAPERFAAADISDFPWTEIDVSDDVAGARETVPAARPDPVSTSLTHGLPHCPLLTDSARCCRIAQ